MSREFREFSPPEIWVDQNPEPYTLCLPHGVLAQLVERLNGIEKKAFFAHFFSFDPTYPKACKELKIRYLF